MEHVIANLLQDFERGKMSRRQLIQSLALAATAASAAATTPAAASASSVIKAVNVNHISYQVADFKKTRDWYSDVFGIKIASNEAKRADLALGETLLSIHTRPSPDTPILDHICFTLANWDEDKNLRPSAEAELKLRGLNVTSNQESLFVMDPDGLKVQMGGRKQ